jgi:hypothetical protein
VPCRFFLTALTIAVLARSAHADDGPDSAIIRASVERALVPLERAARQYNEHRDCFSCHNQAIPALAFTTARERGFTVSDESLGAIQDVTEHDLTAAIDDYRAGRGQGGGATRAGYALWTLELLGREPDELTESVATYLIREARDGHWRSSSHRPPTEASPYTTTAVALRGILAFGPGSHGQELRRHRPAALAWLYASMPRDTEDRVFALWTASFAGVDATARADLFRPLLESQNADGGWSQQPGMASDAYATGTVLVALHRAGGLTTDGPAYRAGVTWLLRHQLPDGSWFVASRSRPFQPYFESGFPHGANQFISCAASAWAATALALACP